MHDFTTSSLKDRQSMEQTSTPRLDCKQAELPGSKGRSAAPSPSGGSHSLVEYPGDQDRVNKLLNFIHDVDDGAECTFSKFHHHTKLGGVADMPEESAVIQRDLNRTEKWAEKFQGKCQDQHQWRNNPRPLYRP